MPVKVKEGLEIANYFFTAFFTFEFLIKISSFGRRYFRDNWNIFDFVIVLCSLFIPIISNLNLPSFNTSSQVLRSLRVGRMFRLFRNLK